MSNLFKTHLIKLSSISSFSVGLLLVSNNVLADRCPVSYISNAVEMTPKIMKLNGDFAYNTTPQVTSCYYNPDENSASVSMIIKWTGPFTGDPYWVNGYLKVLPNGNTWRTTGRNANKAGWDVFNGVMNEMAK